MRAQNVGADVVGAGVPVVGTGGTGRLRRVRADAIGARVAGARVVVGEALGPIGQVVGQAAPLPLQVSGLVQSLLAELPQAVPAALPGCVQTPLVQTSLVQVLPSSAQALPLSGKCAGAERRDADAIVLRTGIVVVAIGVGAAKAAGKGRRRDDKNDEYECEPNQAANHHVLSHVIEPLFVGIRDAQSGNTPSPMGREAYEALGDETRGFRRVSAIRSPEPRPGTPQEGEIVADRAWFCNPRAGTPRRPGGFCDGIRAPEASVKRTRL